jgi:selenide,water dikinase
VKLTTLARNLGCASKIAPADLEAVLSRLPPVKDPAVISGLAAADDAGIYRLTDELCLVQTVDVFTPCVDDARLFGRICAANCLSDIYAMGGVPRTALSILAFPSETMPGDIMYEMLAGAMETLGEAGVALIGGHSIKDEEIKLGFAITGIIDPKLAASLDAPQAGDVLVLTKPLGTGVLGFAQQVGRAHAPGMAEAARSMTTLNRAAAEAMRAAGASACTDITGFGLFGHLLRLLRPRQIGARLCADALPAFDGVLGLLRDEVIPGAVERNREFADSALEVGPDVDPAYVNLGLDAQTSGGLLIAIPPARLERLQQELAERGVRGIVIGELVEKSRVAIMLSAAGAPTTPVFTKNTMHSTSSSSQSHQPDCCADAFVTGTDTCTTGESQQAFGALMRAVQAGGALDAKAKELILFALVVQSRCTPCFEAHYQKARGLGITQAELDEAAWCAIAMGGAPVKMFYQECLKRAPL